MHLQWEFAFNAFLTIRLCVYVCARVAMQSRVKKTKNGLNNAQNYLFSGEVSQLGASSRGRNKRQTKKKNSLNSLNVEKLSLFS